jgi:hypothetical protein
VVIGSTRLLKKGQVIQKRGEDERETSGGRAFAASAFSGTQKATQQADLSSILPPGPLAEALSAKKG